MVVPVMKFVIIPWSLEPDILFFWPIFTLSKAHSFKNEKIQWNLDLRKILGVTKIFLKSRFFLISNTRKPLKKHNFAK